MGSGSGSKPRWAPRIPQHKLRRLYEGAAAGRLDDELLDDVGIGLYLRCRSVLTCGAIFSKRQLPCPACAAMVSLGHGTSLPDPAALLHCDACGWELPWGDYWATFRHQELGPGGAADLFADYLREWEAARTPSDKLLAVDRIIHRWHWETATSAPSFGLGRPTGVNLIEGGRADVLVFLDQLTYGSASPAGIAAARDAWRARWEEVRARQRAWREDGMSERGV